MHTLRTDSADTESVQTNNSIRHSSSGSNSRHRIVNRSSSSKLAQHETTSSPISTSFDSSPNHGLRHERQCRMQGGSRFEDPAVCLGAGNNGNAPCFPSEQRNHCRPSLMQDAAAQPNDRRSIETRVLGSCCAVTTVCLCILTAPCYNNVRIVK